MAGQLPAAEPTVRRFEAAIERIDDDEVVLSDTYFYAESGGQPADRGTIGGVQVVDVQAIDGEHVHSLAEPIDATTGDIVTGIVDDAFRTYCMRAHTASHALYGAGRRLLEDLGYGGFDIDETKVRVDFTTSTDIDDDVLVDLERLVNRAVWDSLPVSWTEVPVEEAHAMDDIAFNTKTEEGAMADADTVRVVTIEGGTPDAESWDVAACGGTHVSNTGEIGPIEVLSRSNPGEGLTRVEFAVGPVGIDRRATVHSAALAAARTVDSSVEGLPDAVERISDERDALADQVSELRTEVLESRLGSLPTIDRNGDTWAIGSLEGFDSNDVGAVAKEFAGEAANVVAIVEDATAPFVVVASDGTVDAGEVIDDVTGEFGGGGGGSRTFAQGGGLGADAATVRAYLEDAA
ncbi:MAG: alanine--tRNA ligase-related protein [Halobacteriota archaeon]